VITISSFYWNSLIPGVEISNAELVHSQTWNNSKTPEKVIGNSEFSEWVNVNHPAEDEKEAGVRHARVRDVENAEGWTKRVQDLKIIKIQWHSFLCKVAGWNVILHHKFKTQIQIIYWSKMHIQQTFFQINAIWLF